MLSLNKLQDLAKNYQTDFRNVAREYIQHQFLAFLYQIPQSDKLFFKGGTALRIIFGSPRFSEDLDFTGQNIYSPAVIDEIFLEAARKIADIGIVIDIKEAKPTTGGYLGIIDYELYGLREAMKFEVSLRKGKQLNGEVSTVVSELNAPYAILDLSAAEIVKGKIAALLDRKKPRDFYDLYFILRHSVLRASVTNKDLSEARKVLEKSKINFKQELRMLLPQSHHVVLRDFKNLLRREVVQWEQ